MRDFWLIWLVSAVAVVAVVYLVKSARRRRLAAMTKFHWPGTIVIALIIGAVPAFLFYNQTPRAVDVPEGVAERPNISNLTKD
mgnify:FL=1